MLSEAQLKQLAQEITGRDDPLEALAETLRNYIEQKLGHYRQEILRLERKYGFTYAAFVEKLGQELPLTWEHEQDYMAWEEALTNLEYMQTLNRKLTVHA
jgi:hypothetical protein